MYLSGSSSSPVGTPPCCSWSVRASVPVAPMTIESAKGTLASLAAALSSAYTPGWMFPPRVRLTLSGGVVR